MWGAFPHRELLGLEGLAQVSLLRSVKLEGPVGPRDLVSLPRSFS